MSTPADDATRSSGNGNSISSASADGERSVIPGEGENLAVSTNVEEPATSIEGGKPDQPTNTSGSATPQGDAEEKGQNDCASCCLRPYPMRNCWRSM